MPIYCIYHIFPMNAESTTAGATYRNSGKKNLWMARCCIASKFKVQNVLPTLALWTPKSGDVDWDSSISVLSKSFLPAAKWHKCPHRMGSKIRPFWPPTPPRSPTPLSIHFLFSNVWNFLNSYLLRPLHAFNPTAMYMVGVAFPGS